eukprot:TRINITY_DN17005_c0_g1_i3.p2 TRINITY_DN17005_c0_g1~~TRINITY_DN17005_c0_g1_i3.p2  ORF type:complete len:250 (+),score=83.83 TRINITY_DN17005_c0_g1_i3:314-1063(+)
MLKNDKNVGIGAVDCDIDRGICAKYGVNGFPALKAIVGGKGKSYNGPREAEPIKEWILKVAANRGTKGGSAKCAIGSFKSKIKDAVVPLCEEHFPDEKAKHDWLVVFYNSKSSDAATLKESVNRLALDMGNDPPDMNKALKKPKKRRDRLTEVASKYDLKVKLPAKGPFGMDALIKVGGVCCDCGEEAEAFCASSLKLGEEDFKPPQVFWASKGSRNMLKGAEMTAAGLAASALEKLGFSEGGSAKTEL